jgi:glutathione synthase/RimK-type ligase-like ATP-grasp enzyme
MALRICNDLDLTYAAVDMLETDDHAPCVIEVNAIPGWKGAQGVVPFSIAERIVASLVSAAESKLA